MAKKKYNLPNIHEVIIKNMEGGIPLFHQFLLNCIPNSIQSLQIGIVDSKIPSLDNCYCSGIIDATSKVKYEAVFQGLVLSVSNFEGIVKAGSQVERLSL